MSPETIISTKSASSRKAILLLFVAVVTLSFFTSHGALSFDPATRLKVTQSIVDYGDLQYRLTPEEVEALQGQPGNRLKGADGNYYTRWFSLGQSLIFAGPYYVVRHLLGIESDTLIRIMISLSVFPLTLGLTAWICFLLLREFGFSNRQCFLVSVLLIFSTGLWQLAREGQDGSHVAFLFTLAAYSLRRYQKEASIGFLALSALAIGSAFLTRTDIAPTVICYLIFVIYLIEQHHRRDPTGKTLWHRCLPYVLIISLTLPALLIEFAYNFKRFGSPVASYSREYSLEILITGLKGLLFSPGKSLFLYNPIILLAIPGLVSLWRQHRTWAMYIIFGFTGCLLLHASIINFHGNICWGPRYLCRYFPLLFVPIAFFLFRVPQWSLIRRSTIIVIAALSIGVQIAAVSLHCNRELSEMNFAAGPDGNHKQWTMLIPKWTMFEPEAHILKHRFQNLSIAIDEMIHGKIPPWPAEKPLPMTQDNKVQDPNLRYLAFWPFHLTYYLPTIRPDLALPLWGSTLVLLIGIIIGLLLLWWGWR